MGTTKVERPVWRRFSPQFMGRAAEWVKSGGSAAIVFEEKKVRALEVAANGESIPKRRVTRVDILLGVEDKGRLTELGLWSLLAIEQRVSRVVPSGAAKGLRIARAAKHSIPAVLDWCERDGVFADPTRTLKFDCLACGSCCFESDVVLDQDDLDRFREGGRPDLTTSRYIKRSRDGKIRLRFAKHSACQHLGTDLKCAIYTLRPFNCSVFPVGSEACLAARESTRNWRDDGSPIPKLPRTKPAA